MNAPYDECPRYHYSIALDLSGRKVLVVGGGKVALRKVKSLAAAGADVVLIAERIHEDLFEEGVAWHKRPFSPQDIFHIRPLLCIAATDSIKTNQQVVRACQEAGVLVNVVDDSAPSDFIVQGTFSRGDLMISVSSNGRSPGFSRQVRQELEKTIDARYGQALEVSALLRKEILDLPIPQEERAQILRQIRIKDILLLLQDHSQSAVIERMRGCLFSS